MKVTGTKLEQIIILILKTVLNAHEFEIIVDTFVMVG
jgi:hypothetical protein